MTRVTIAPAATGNGRETPDIETSSEAYARRFSGPVGAWFLDLQRRLTLELLAPFPRATILDVGGGHAQITGALVEAGHALTVYGSDPACAARLRPWLDTRSARFLAGDLLRAPWPDAAFDVVLAFRLLPHVARWKVLVTELTRLARHAVIVDYPTRRSLNAAADLLFGWKLRVERDTRPFTVFRDGDLTEAFAAGGFRPAARRPQLFWPMALHRALGMPGLSRALERLATTAGLTRRLGSPVILALERAHGA